MIISFKLIVECLKKRMICWYVLIFIFKFTFVFSANFISSNGENFLVFSQETSRIEKIDFDFMKKGYNIEYIEIGVLLDGIPYSLSTIKHETRFSEKSNIIKFIGELENSKFEIEIYSSMINKKNIVIRSHIIKKEDNRKISFYYSIKPKVNNVLQIENGTVSFNDFKVKGENINFYLTEDTESLDKKLNIIKSGIIIQKNQCLFLVNNSEVDSYITLGRDVEHSGNIVEEESFWREDAGTEIMNSLLISLKMLKYKGIPIDISFENPQIKTKDLLDLLKLYLLQKKYTESKQILKYFLYDISKEIQGKIPSNYIDLLGNEIPKKDSYGIYNSVYIRSQFLNLYIEYLKSSGDKLFFEETYSIVKNNIVDWIEKNLDTNGILPDSGDNRVGKDGYKRYIETQYETYKAYSTLSSYLSSKGIKNDSYTRIANSLKEILILYYIDGYKISDFPFAKDMNPKNILYVNDDLFIDNSEYYKALQFNIDIIRKMDINLGEKINFAICLYDKKYYLMAENLKNEIDKELQGDSGLEILQNDLNLLINYLILRQKGVNYGLNK